MRTEENKEESMNLDGPDRVLAELDKRSVCPGCGHMVNDSALEAHRRRICKGRQASSKAPSTDVEPGRVAGNIDDGID